MRLTDDLLGGALGNAALRIPLITQQLGRFLLKGCEPLRGASFSREREGEQTCHQARCPVGDPNPRPTRLRLRTISRPEGGQNLDYSGFLRSKRQSRFASASVSRLRIFEDRPTTRRGAFESLLLVAHSAQTEGPVRGQSSWQNQSSPQYRQWCRCSMAPKITMRGAKV